MIRLDARIETFRLRAPFSISRGSKTETVVVTASLHEGNFTGRGECGPNIRYGETPEGVLDAIQAMGPAVAAGLDRLALQTAMPPGAARNALDCAFWDLAAKQAGRRVWELAGLPAPGPVVTAFTLSVDTPQAMAASARANAHRPVLKIKLSGRGDVARVEAVRAGAPAARLIVDANEAWAADMFAGLSVRLAELGVELIEQPLPAGDDSALAAMPHPVSVCADESCRDAAGVAALADRYEVVNIKLDKAGGLTEALAVAAAARENGMNIMVGCMVGTSLAMAPAVLVAQHAGFVDLDGPLLLAQDRVPGLKIDVSMMSPPSAGLWG